MGEEQRERGSIRQYTYKTLTMGSNNQTPHPTPTFIYMYEYLRRYMHLIWASWGVEKRTVANISLKNNSSFICCVTKLKVAFICNVT